MQRIQTADQFGQRISHYLMPAVLGCAVWMAQSSYNTIKSQLDRIEARQQSDNVSMTRLEMRVLQLERLTGNNSGAAVKQPATPDAAR